MQSNYKSGSNPDFVSNTPINNIEDPENPQILRKGSSNQQSSDKMI